MAGRRKNTSCSMALNGKSPALPHDLLPYARIIHQDDVDGLCTFFSCGRSRNPDLFQKSWNLIFMWQPWPTKGGNRWEVNTPHKEPKKTIAELPQKNIKHEWKLHRQSSTDCLVISSKSKEGTYTALEVNTSERIVYCWRPSEPNDVWPFPFRLVILPTDAEPMPPLEEGKA